MKKIKASQVLIPTVYLMGIAVVALCLVAVGKGISNYADELDKNGDNLQQVYEDKNNDIINDNIDKYQPTETTPNGNTEPTIASSTIIKPYLSKEVKLSRSYYDEKASEKEQENSIIFYGNTYVQNMGSEYSAKNKFDVINVIDGTVSTIKKDSTLGYIVEIKHENELVTSYQYLESVNVKEGSTILKGDVIGSSGKSVVAEDNKYTLHFEVYHKGKSLNPETLYTMTVEDFK